MKVSEAISSSLKLLGAVSNGQAPTAQDMTDSIRVLNQMMRRWEKNGLALGWNDVSRPSEDLPIQPDAEEAIIYNLALRLRPYWGVEISPDVVALAQQGLSELRRDRMVESPLSPDSFGGGTYDTRSDQYL